ncbi:cytochrome P450 [Fennellomyces sp. T-0311]|nr:cytochrome P450 [Fennellomyces sp. T-0311]
MSDLLLSNPIGAVALVSAAALGLLAAKYNDRAVFTPRRDDLPTLPGVPLFGNLFAQIANKDRIIDYTLDHFDKFNTMTMYGSALGLPPLILTINPDNVEHVLKNNFSNYVKGSYFVSSINDLFGHGIFAANGEQWRYQRKAASLIFNVSNFRDHFTEVFVKEIDVLSKCVLDKKAETGEPIDFQDMVYKFTLESFVFLGFGKTLDIITSKDDVPFAASFDTLQRNCFKRLVDPLTDFRETLKPILHPGQTTIKDHVKVVDGFAYALIEERKEQLKQGHQYKDLLSRFMATHNEDGQPLSDIELRDMVLNFIIAGRDTTAQALSWTIHYLLQYPRVAAKLVAEVDTHITNGVEKDAPALYETVKKMVYAHAVLYEVLRLEPVVPSNAKVALEDDVLPDGTFVRKNDQVLWSPYAMGRSTKIWGEDAKDFRPERWITPEGELRRETAFKWPAFHGGPRVCLGQNLATLEALVALSLLLKRYTFSYAPGQKVQYEMSLTHPMKHGIKVFVSRRQ